MQPKLDCSAVTAQVLGWLEHVVIGLNLCPFAAVPFRNNQIRIAISSAADERQLLVDFQQELQRLHETPASELETTLIVVTEMLCDFHDYNEFLDVVDRHLRRAGWSGEFQVASFHPQYQFAGTEPDDVENLTNRSPWPILHLLREASLDDAVANYRDTDAIPARNIERMNALTVEEQRQLFPWLFNID